MKKFLFSMICTLLPILASAQVQNEELTPYAVLSDDHTVLTFFYDNDKESQGGMDVGPFTSADERGWNEYCESIEQVVFVEAFAGCEAITSTRYWFQNFTNLTTIIGLGNLKTNHVTDMGSMFAVCSSLTNLDLNGFDTSNATDMAHMFAGCSSLTSLDLSGFITSNVTDMALMFSGCSGLTSLDLGDFNTSNVTTMWAMFNGCSNLTNLDVSEFDTSNATNMSAMFEDCSGLTSLDVSNFNTDNVTNMGNMFNGCSNLESLDISNFNTVHVTNMGSMFGGCSKLTTLDLSGFDTSSATDLGHMFALCSGLTSLDVTGFNTSNATNMVCMFEGCSGLTSLDVSNFDTSNATNLSSMFILCSGLTSLDVSGFNTSNATDLSSMFAGCSGLTSLDVSGSFDTSNATNLSAIFEDCSSLTNLDLSGFNTANATNLSSMFIRCSGLTSLDVSNFNTANVTDMGNMFDGCSKLVSLDVSGLNTGNVTNMGYMFSDCLKLTSPLDVSEFNTANVVRMDYMFNHCESLTALDVSNFNTANVTTMGSMFNYCSNLESLDVSNFNTEKVTYMAWMFADCSNLTSLDVSNFNTTNVTDMGAMFTSCSGLTELDLSNFDTSNTTTLELFFNKCSGLTSLDLSNFNTANVKNMDSMFSQCSGLETISTGNEWSTENIESGAGMFTDCTALVGGAGTEYNANHVDYTYARVDGGATNPGYFTDPNQPVPYAVLNEGNTVLTFYYDNQKAARGGMGVGPFTLNLSNKTVNSGWDEVRENIQQVVFNESFANCTTITSTSCWFYGFTNLTSFKDLENLKTDNVTDMSYMFSGCSSLTNLDLSSFTTSSVTDMQFMFSQCSGLETIYVGNGWSLESISSQQYGAEMFAGCTALVGGAGTIYDPDHVNVDYAHIDGGSSNPGYLSGAGQAVPYAVLNEDNSVLTFYYDDQKAKQNGMSVGPFTESSQKGWYYQSEFIEQVIFDESFANCTTITSTSWWFNACTSLTTITGLENLKTDNVTNMSGMFYECYELTSLDLSGFNTSMVTDMGGMFYGCSGFTSLDVSGFNTSNVTMMANMFGGCSGLTSLDVSGFDTSKATNMSFMFSYCHGLTSLDLSGFNTANVTLMAHMFLDCISLNTIYVGEGWSTEKILSEEDGIGMFNGCTKLIGGAGTTYDANHVDYTYAHIDGGTTNPGYLSGAGQAEPYAVLSENDTVLTFYYDNKKEARGGTDVGPFTVADERGWNEQSGNIKQVKFVESFTNCTTITSTSYWFYGFTYLTTITGLENLNTDNVTDMSYMFSECRNLKNLDVNNFNTSNVISFGGMFMNCYSLKSLDVSGFDTSKATNMGKMFGCNNLTNLNVSGFDTSNVTDMNSMFSGCSSLKSLDVSGFNTSKVTNMNYMFGDCYGLTSLDVSNFNTSNTTNMNGMFSGCSSLKSLDVSGFNTSKVTNMSHMFFLCTDLPSLDLSGFDTSKVTDMNSMFQQCESLPSLDVSGFNTENVTDMSQMFKSCTSLTSLDLSVFNTAKVSEMGYMFDSCSSLTTIYAEEGWSTENISSEDAGANMFQGCTKLIGGAGTALYLNHVDYTYAHIDGGTSNPGYFTRSGDEPWNLGLEPYAVLSDNYTLLTFYYDDKRGTRGDSRDVGPFGTPSMVSWDGASESIERVVFDESFANCTTITSTSYWFYDFTKLTTIIGLDNFKTDKVEDMEYMFAYCSSLKSLDLSTFNTSKVTNMSHMFEQCWELTSLDVSGFDTSKAKDMSQMFKSCTSLTSLDLTGFNTANVTNMWEMFAYCSSLKNLDVSIFNTTNVDTFQGMFKECTSLTNLDLSGFNTANATNMWEMFAYCSSLTSLDLSSFNTSNVDTFQGMFEECTSLTSLDLSSFNIVNAQYMNTMFKNCSNLTTIYVGEGWTTPQHLGSDNSGGMFRGCTAIIGGAGTTYDEAYVNFVYAHIDGGASNPGYLTDINGTSTASDEAWAELNKAVETGEKLQTEAKGVSTVEPWALEELENMTAKGSEMYKVHTAGEEEVRHMTEELNQIINEVEEMMRKQPQGEASFDGLTAYVSGNATLDDAFKSVGGRSEAAKTIAAIVWNADNALTADMLSGIDNPNLLVYVTEASKAPSGVQNVIIDGVASEIVLTDATGNNNFYCPQSFTAKSISYSRDFSQTTEIDVCRGWETIALPFDVQSITHESHGTLVPFGGSDNGYPFWLRQLSTNGLARATKIEANRPYLICMPNNIIYPPEYNQNGTVTFSSSNVTVPVTSARSSTSAGVTLHATFQQVTKSSSVYALNVGETRGEYPEGSVFEQNYRDIRPFQAYTTHRASTRSFITLESLGGNDDATGIEELRIKNSEFGDAEGVWYSLDGRRLDAKPTKKGVYVKDGRKIVIK